MPWTRLDDNFDTSPKLLCAIEEVGDSAGWLWVRAVNHCNKHLTDGVLARAVVPTLTRHKAPFKVVKALVDAGAFEAVDGGYLVHDFLDWNESRQKIMAGRNALKERQADWRKRQRNETPDNTGDVNVTRYERVTNGSTERFVDASLSSPLLSTPGDKSPSAGVAHTRTHSNTEAKARPLAENQIGPETTQILAALRAHGQLKQAANVQLAEQIAGRAMAAGRPIAGVIEAISEAARDIGAEQAATQMPLSVAAIGTKIAKYADRPRRTSGSTGQPQAPVRTRGPAPLEPPPMPLELASAPLAATSGASATLRDISASMRMTDPEEDHGTLAARR